MPFLQHSLGKTYYITRGRRSADGLPIIGLHGGPGATHFLQRRLLELSKERQVILYDQLGCGRSVAKKGVKWSVPLFVNELNSLIAALSLERFHLYGGSWGTTLALEYYLRKRNNGVASLTFVSPMFSAKLWAQDAKKLIKRLPKHEQKVIRLCEEIGATDAKVYEQASKSFSQRFVYRKKQYTKNIQLAAKHYNLEIYNKMWGPSEFCATGTLKSYDRLKDLRRIKVPTRIICGEYDEATPATCKLFKKRIQGASLRVLKGCSHVSIEEKPRLFLKTIKEWLREAEK